MTKACKTRYLPYFLIPFCKFIPAGQSESQFINQHYLKFSADPADLVLQVSFSEAEYHPQCTPMYIPFTLFTLQASAQLY